MVHAQFLYTTNFTYETNGPAITTNGTITITGYDGSGGEIIIPCMTNGYPVTSIGEEAFNFNSSITSVIIPNSVTNIGDSAFSTCSGLTNIEFGTNLADIGNFTFQFCTGLTNVVIPDSVNSIGFEAFSSCYNLANVSIGCGVTNINEGPFIFPSGASLNGTVFEDCTNLTAIIVNTNNPAFSSLGGVLFDKNQNTLLVYPAGLGGTYAIPNSITSIGVQAFFDCYNLTSIQIGDGVTNVEYEFEYPSGLSVESSIFLSCPNITNITTSAENPAYSSLDGVLFSKDGTKLIEFPSGRSGDYLIPTNVTEIGDLAFANCNNLTKVIIDSSVTNIETQVFLNCANLTGIFFEGNAPHMYENDFEVTTIYYLPGTTGWNTFFENVPITLWLPQMETADGSFGVQTNQFGFNINWASGQTVVVESSTNLLNPAWEPLQTNLLTNCSVYFSDPQWTNYPSRYYRVSSQ
jgi:hypothetical protein